MIVDSISGAVDIPTSEIQKTPSFTVKIDTDLSRIGQINGSS